MNTWYQDFRKTFEPMYNNDFALFCDLLAATSQQCHVKTNYKRALQAYNSYKCKGKADTKGMMKVVKKNVYRAIKRQSLSGRKISAFAANLKGDLTQVTVDTWIAKHFGFSRRFSGKEYQIMSDHIKAQAERLQVFPAILQAKIWCDTIKAHGKKPTSYVNCIDKQLKLWED